MASELTLEHVAKSYPGPAGPVQVLADINLRVERGGFVTILGGNGCGKSTLLRAVAGMEEPDGGAILLDGEAGRRLGRVGLVGQEVNLFPWRTTLENVAFGLEMQGMAKARRLELAEAYLRAFGLGDRLRHYPAELSGGMRQKAAIARTLVAAPDIILMDEPFSALDYQTRTGLQCFLLQLWARFRETIVFVTHEVEEAVFLSDHIVIISPVPAVIRQIVPVPLPRPRLRASREFMEVAAEVLKSYGAMSCMGDQELRSALTMLARHKAERRNGART